MQCSKINTHSRKCMILLECLHDHSLVPEFSPTPSHSPKPRMRILISICLLLDNPPMCISIGPSPMIDIIYGLPSDISIGSSPTIDIFSFKKPSDNSHFRQPSEPFSLDSSHALTPIVLGCSSAYGMHVCQFQYSLITCKYVNMHIST